MPLTFDIVTTAGTQRHEEGVEKVVLRRREADHDPGSEVVILPRHGALLMQTQPCVVRFTLREETQQLPVGAGVLEVFHDHVTLVET
jgi:F0F1-type ATP synthase epsilon subunit